MGAQFLKSLKWFFFVCFIIGGIAAFIATEGGNIKPLILAVFSLGAAYLMSASWRELPRFAMALSILLVGTLAVAAKFLPGLAYELAGVRITYDYFVIWAGLVFFPGIPAMMFIFSKYGE